MFYIVCAVWKRYQNQQIRVTSKKRDDLQEVIQMVKDSKLEIPLNNGNFRD